MANLEYEQRIVAFIDILGFKEIVKESERDSAKMEALHSVLTYLRDWQVPEKWDLKMVEIEEDAQKRGVENFDISKKTNVTAFSDCIVVSVKVQDNINEMVSTLVINLAFIGAYSMENGIIIRGGITFGNLFHNNEGMVFGQAMIDAYYLESKNAKYPRIVFSDILLDQLNYPIESKRDKYPYHQYVDRFEDGAVGFHQMVYFELIQNWDEISKNQLAEKLDKIRKVIIRGLDGSFENLEVFGKYLWLKNQYNKLIIFEENDLQNNSKEIIKLMIREPNEGIAGKNIHYFYTDDFYLKKKEAL